MGADDGQDETIAVPPLSPAYSGEPVYDYPPTGYIPVAPSGPGRTRWVLSLAALLATVAALLWVGTLAAGTLRSPAPAPPAVTVTAAPPDKNDAFLTDLSAAGVSGLADRLVVVNNGYKVCIAMGGGLDGAMTQTEVVARFRQFGIPQPETFVRLAIKDYCPNGHL